MNRIFRAYYVWPKFPSISMSGNTCVLHCKHCNHAYLNAMENLSEPEHLLNACRQYAGQGAVGILLSGGCDSKGRILNLPRIIPVIKQIKQENNLIIKLHTGFVDQTLAEDLVSAGVDIASVEVVGSNETIHDIFGFHATINDYTQTLEYLESAGVPYIVPHICIGLHYGKLNGESKALDIIQNTCAPSSLVMIVFRPTKGTAMQSYPSPSPQNIVNVIRKAKTMFPQQDISLGCMRPRSHQRQEIETAALDAGVNRMEIPAKPTLQYAQSLGYTIKKIAACCALPEELEHHAVIG